MINLLQNVTTILMILTLASFTSLGQNTVNIEGNWLGAIEFSGLKLRLVLKVSKAADGALTAKLDSLDQGANDLPLETIAQKETGISFSGAKLGVSFDGTLNEKGDEISGIFKQGA